MADRTVTVRLVADAHAYIQGVAEAERKTREATQSIEQRLASQRQAYQTVGTAAVAFGGAITATGVAALRTGVQYNTLRQTTTAALTSILGSAQAAADQMDRLDDFARNSPFSRQTFLEAQQQMLAFGVETEKVIPYLDAIQQAVAAAGGSNADIAELAEIMARISSTSRITAVDLQMFGRRGVDAAEIIGNAMGMTAVEVRDSITNSTLDAGQALDALAEGMQVRFAGASDNVKNTFEGAMDRVRAAWRDLGAELARPLVDPNGGGALVDMANMVADLLRWFEALPGPVRDTVAGIGFATGAIALLGGTAMLAVPKVTELSIAMDTLGIRGGSALRNSMGRTANFLLGPWGIAIAAAAVGLAVLNNALADAHATADQFSNVLNTNVNPDSIIGLLNDGQFARGMSDDLENVQVLLRQLESGLYNILNAPFGNLSDLNRFKDSLGELDTAMSSLSLERATAMFDEFGQAVEATPEQIEAMLDQMPQFRSELFAVADALGLNLEEMQDWERQLWLAEAATGGFRDANGQLVDVSHLVTNATSGAVEVLDEQTVAANDAAAALELLTEALQALNNDYVTSQDALQAYGDELREATAAASELSGVTLTSAGDIDVLTESGSSAHDILRDFANVALDAASTMLELDGDIQGANQTVAEAREEFIELLGQMGITGEAAEDLADRYGLTEDAVLLLHDAIGNIPDGEAEITVETLLAQQAIDQFIADNRDHGIVVNVTPNISGQVDPRDLIVHNDQRGLYNTGGRLPGFSPGRDDRFGWLPNGDVVGLAGGEWVINPLMSRKYDRVLDQINRGIFPGYAGGGQISQPNSYYSSSSQHVANVTVNMNVSALPGMDENALASLASNRAVSRVAESLRG